MSLPENDMSSETTQHFRITVKGEVHPSWSDWFNGMEILSRSEPEGTSITILTGVIKDQAALRGLLTRLWDQNISLISLQEIDPPEAGLDNASSCQTTGYQQE
jgi:hypothetical protein